MKIGCKVADAFVMLFFAPGQRCSNRGSTCSLRKLRAKSHSRFVESVMKSCPILSRYISMSLRDTSSKKGA